jgi:hypothetical protein
MIGHIARDAWRTVRGDHDHLSHDH